jgi:hypothetical protein
MIKQRAQTTKQSLKTTKSSPCTHANSPWTNAAPPGWKHANHLIRTEQLHQLSSDRSDWSPPPVRLVCNMRTGPSLWPVRPVTLTSQTPVHNRAQKWHENRTSTLTSQTGDLDRSDRCTTEPRNGSKPLENLLNASSSPKQAQTSPPCWQCMNQAKNAKDST